MRTVCGLAWWLAMAASTITLGDSAPQLADAVERKEAARIRALLQERADVNTPQVDGMTALHWATYLDDLETAQLLVTAGANVKAENRYGVAPLSLACTNGNAALVELLLGAGADPGTTLRGGETVLMTAARTGKLAPVTALLARGAEVNARESHGQTALHWAAAQGHVDVVKALLAAGADFKTPLPSGFTPLFFAVREGRLGVVRVLLEAGAEVNAALEPQKSGSKAPRKGSSPLLLAVENGHFELALALLAAGADPNDQRSGFTALHALSWVRKTGRGDDEEGDPPPDGSGILSSLDFASALVAQGADVNARLARGASGPGKLSRKGATPFLLAASTADAPFLQRLIELKADPQLANADGSTPLMAAAGLGTFAPSEEAGTESEVLEALTLILKHGGDINAVDKNGETAMHGAAYKNLPEVVTFLAERGARIETWNRPNKHGWTPLAIAAGYRPGNFKPSPATTAALHRVLQAAGVQPAASVTPKDAEKKLAY